MHECITHVTAPLIVNYAMIEGDGPCYQMQRLEGKTKMRGTLCSTQARIVCEYEPIAPGKLVGLGSHQYFVSTAKTEGSNMLAKCQAALPGSYPVRLNTEKEYVCCLTFHWT